MKLIIINIALLFFGITLQARTAATAQYDSSIPRFTGIGYNALKANPDGNSLYGSARDPGILFTNHIFEFTYYEGEHASYQDTEIQIPDQVEFDFRGSYCVTHELANAFSGQKSYKEGLSESVDLNMGGEYKSIISALFSMSDAMSEMRQETEEKKSVVVQKTKTCEYGIVRYKLADALTNTPGYNLTTNFKNAVQLLPLDYSIDDYANFLDGWGTHIITKASVGTREITRRSATYTDIYNALSEESSTLLDLGISLTPKNGTGGGNLALSFSSSEVKNFVTSTMDITKRLTEFTIGTQTNPVPIEISAVPIFKALNDNFWSVHQWENIRIKKAHLKKALKEYVTHHRTKATIASDPLMLIEFQWPRGKFSLLKPASGCPIGMSSGWIYQDNQDRGSNNWWHPKDLDSCVDISYRGNMKTNFCTQDSESGSPSWPRGTYCIAKYGDKCPPNFRKGSIFWDDENNNNDNDIMDPVPSGKYVSKGTCNHCTQIDFCCRSDENHNTRIYLPPTEPFVLYRYHDSCQRVHGMNEPMDLWVKSDDEDDNNKNHCTGSHPDATCDNDRNQKIHFCYYTPRLMNGCKMNPCGGDKYTICEPTGHHDQLCNAYNCRCENTSSEIHCVAKFRVKARLARNLLRDVDGPRDNCDPFMEITARTLDGHIITKRSRSLNNDANPDWNDWFDFGRGQWKNVTVSIWDRDTHNGPDRLCDDYTLDLLMGGYDDRRFNCYGGGHGEFNYRLTL